MFYVHCTGRTHFYSFRRCFLHSNVFRYCFFFVLSLKFVLSLHRHSANIKMLAQVGKNRRNVKIIIGRSRTVHTIAQPYQFKNEMETHNTQRKLEKMLERKKKTKNVCVYFLHGK